MKRLPYAKGMVLEVVHVVCVHASKGHIYTLLSFQRSNWKFVSCVDYNHTTELPFRLGTSLLHR